MNYLTFDNYEIDPSNAQPDVCLSAILSENKDADNISGTLEVAIKNIMNYSEKEHVTQKCDCTRIKAKLLLIK